MPATASAHPDGLSRLGATAPVANLLSLTASSPIHDGTKPSNSVFASPPALYFVYPSHFPSSLAVAAVASSL